MVLKKLFSVKIKITKIINFFHLGPDNDWKKLWQVKIQKKLLNLCFFHFGGLRNDIELGYLYNSRLDFFLNKFFLF